MDLIGLGAILTPFAAVVGYLLVNRQGVRKDRIDALESMTRTALDTQTEVLSTVLQESNRWRAEAELCHQSLRDLRTQIGEQHITLGRYAARLETAEEKLRLLGGHLGEPGA